MAAAKRRRSKRSREETERAIEDAIIASPDALGYPGALAIRNVCFQAKAGRVDVLLLPQNGTVKVVLVEAKRHNASDADGRVIGQLLKYFTCAKTLTLEDLRPLEAFAIRCPELAHGDNKTPPTMIARAFSADDVCERRLENRKLRADEIDLVIAINGKPKPVLVQNLCGLADDHRLHIRLISVIQGQITDITNQLEPVQVAKAKRSTPQVEVPSKAASSEEVWITPTGRTYHGDGCKSLIRRGQEQQKLHTAVPLDEAMRQGLRPCAKCLNHRRLD